MHGHVTADAPSQRLLQRITQNLGWPEAGERHKGLSDSLVGREAIPRTQRDVCALKAVPSKPLPNACKGPTICTHLQ